jgi:hypothetical protein
VSFLQVQRGEINLKIQIFQVKKIINKEEIAEASLVLLIKIKVSHHKKLIIIRWPA